MLCLQDWYNLWRPLANSFSGKQEEGETSTGQWETSLHCNWYFFFLYVARPDTHPVKFSSPRSLLGPSCTWRWFWRRAVPSPLLLRCAGGSHPPPPLCLRATVNDHTGTNTAQWRAPSANSSCRGLIKIKGGIGGKGDAVPTRVMQVAPERSPVRSLASGGVQVFHRLTKSKHRGTSITTTGCRQECAHCWRDVVPLCPRCCHLTWLEQGQSCTFFNVIYWYCICHRYLYSCSAIFCKDVFWMWKKKNNYDDMYLCVCVWVCMWDSVVI